MLSLGPAEGCPWGVGEGCPVGRMFHGRRCCPCRGIRGRGGCSFAPVGFSLPWWAVVSPGGIRGRGGLFLCACWLFFAVVGLLPVPWHPLPCWAFILPVWGFACCVNKFKERFARVGCLFGGCLGHDPRRRACLPLHPVYFPAVSFFIMAAVSMFLA